VLLDLVGIVMDLASGGDVAVGVAQEFDDGLAHLKGLVSHWKVVETHIHIQK
jgi:hypothetical protein